MNDIQPYFGQICKIHKISVVFNDLGTEWQFFLKDSIFFDDAREDEQFVMSHLHENQYGI